MLLPLSLTLSLRGAAAFLAPPTGRAAFQLAAQCRAHSTNAVRVAGTPTKKGLVRGLALLLGGTATGMGLQLRTPSRDESRGVQCEAGAVDPGAGVSHRIGNVNELSGGLVTTEHFFSVPLRHGDPTSPSIEVFVRELGLTTHKGKRPPALLFLQGGPGFPAGRPLSPDSGWVKRALQDHSVFLLDQRGTGRSTAVTWQSLAALADPDAQAEYVACMRADAIVRDCEVIRKTMLEPGEQWTVLGQSFGGFCVMAYLSLAPEGLKRALITGGLPPVTPGCSAEEVYRHTYKRAADRSMRFYQRFPQHVQTVREIASVLEAAPVPLPVHACTRMHTHAHTHTRTHTHTHTHTQVPLPDGGVLTSRRFQQLGLCLASGSGY